MSVRTTLTLRDETHHWLTANAEGPHSLGKAIDNLVQRERVLRPITDRVALFLIKLGDLLETGHVRVNRQALEALEHAGGV
jgi:hypothetical protein